MSSESGEVLYSDDYTRLVQFRSRQWTFSDLSLRAIGGLSWEAAAEAVRPALMVIAPVVVALSAVGGFWPSALFVLVPMIYAGMYLRANSRDVEGDAVRTIRRGQASLRGTTARQRRLLAKHFKQEPRHVLGGAADREPTEIEWSVVLYVPGESR